MGSGPSFCVCGNVDDRDAAVRSLVAGGVEEAGSQALTGVVLTRPVPLELVFTSAVKSKVSVPNSKPLNCTSSAAMASSGISTADSGILDACGIRGLCVFGREGRLEVTVGMVTPLFRALLLLLILLAKLLVTTLCRPELEKMVGGSCTVEAEYGVGAEDDGSGAVADTPTDPTRVPAFRLSPTLVLRPLRILCCPPTLRPGAGDTSEAPPPPLLPPPPPLFALLLLPSGVEDTKPLRVDWGAAFCNRAARSMV